MVGVVLVVFMFEYITWCFCAVVLGWWVWLVVFVVLSLGGCLVYCCMCWFVFRVLWCVLCVTLVRVFVVFSVGWVWFGCLMLLWGLFWVVMVWYCLGVLTVKVGGV